METTKRVPGKKELIENGIKDRRIQQFDDCIHSCPSILMLKLIFVQYGHRQYNSRNH
jgi:hypothetical protein